MHGGIDVKITRAVITAAGRGARQYPASDTVQKAMLPLVDRDGLLDGDFLAVRREDAGDPDQVVAGDFRVAKGHFEAGELLAVNPDALGEG
jgi:hypothetical protein